MSKNKNRNKNKGFARIGGSQAATGGVAAAMSGQGEKKDDKDTGFAKLAPKANGDTAFTEFMRKRSKKSDLITTPVLPVAYADYDPSKALSQISKTIEFIRKNKFGKAFETMEKSVVEELVDTFLNMDQDLSNAGAVNETMTKFLQVCKSFYEYDKKQRLIIPNPEYDRVLAKYTGLGLGEPTGIVPETDKKTGIMYPELHNNMDKAYILKKGELIPAGVKETDSVEEFLRRAYDAVKMQTSSDLTIELSPKIDGVSVNGTMKHGCLVDPQTRGDQEASMAIKGLSGIELGEDNEDEFGIQYECFVLDEDRIKAAEYLKLSKPYVGNRHAAAGIINRLCTNNDDELLKFLSFYPIEAVGIDAEYTNRMKLIAQYGCVPDDMIERKVITGSIDELLKKIKKYSDMILEKREGLSYSVDGVVITIVDEDVRIACGRKERTNKYQLGYKFNPADAEGVVAGISLDSGRKGYRTIQVELKHPVFLDGVRYDHVPVLSADLFDKLGLREGSVVNVHRVGDVIPSISMIKEGDGKKIKLPEKCPQCGGKLTINNKKLMCQNSNCRGNVIGKYLGFLDAIGVDGYAESFIEKAIQCINPVFVGYISSFLGITKEQLANAGLTDKLSQEFPAKVSAAMETVPDYRVLGAMGWPDIGPARAKALLKYYGGLTKFVEGFKSDGFGCEWNRALGEVGAKSAKAIQSNYNNWCSLRDDLMYTATWITNVTTDFSEKIKVGHTGGDLTDEAIELCKKLNMEVTDGGSFDILITASKDSDSGKMKTARKKGLPIYTENEFLAEYNK